MNPRNRDARRLRAVRRPHSLINTLSIRPSSKFNDDTSSFRCGSRLVFQSQVPDRETSTSDPGIHRQEARTSCHICQCQRPVSPTRYVRWWSRAKALPQRRFTLCKRTSNTYPVFFSSGHVSVRLGLWQDPTVVGPGEESMPGSSCREASWFVLFCLRRLFWHGHGEDTASGRVAATEESGNESSAGCPFSYHPGHILTESVCAWCFGGGAYRIG